MNDTLDLVQLLDTVAPHRNTNYYQVLTGPFMCGPKHRMFEDALACACDTSVPRKGAAIIQRTNTTSFTWKDYNFANPAWHRLGGRLVAYYERQ